MSASQYRPIPRKEPVEHFGCGCFESSWDLAHGVQVLEDVSIEEFELFMLAQNQPPLNLAS